MLSPSHVHSVQNAFKTIIVGLISLLILWSCSFMIYQMITFDTRKHCKICNKIDGEYFRFGPFVYYSCWCLYTSAITWFAWVWRKCCIKKQPFFASENNNHDDGNDGNNDGLFLMEVSLPLSIYVMIGYTIYIGTNNWGGDIVNTEECDYILTFATHKDDPSKTLYLAGGAITTLTMHYIMPVTNMVLYFNYFTRKAPWRPYMLIGFVFLLSVVIITVQEAGGFILYCENVYTSAVYALLVSTFFHFVLFSTLVTRVKTVLFGAGSSGESLTPLEDHNSHEVIISDQVHAAVEKELIGVDA